MPDTLKDPNHVVQTLANGPIFMGRVGEMHILTFTQAIARADETVVGGASNPGQDLVVVCRMAMTERVLAELVATLQQARMAATPTVGNA